MLFTASQMPNPAECSVVLSLDESIRRHIGFLLKAAERARGRIDSSSVGQLREAPSPWCARSFFFHFPRFHLVEREKLRLRTGI